MSQPFEPISTPAFLACIAFASLIALQGMTGTCFFFLHLIDLPFHEAGHVIFGLISSHLHIIGGSLGQLAFPFITAGYFFMHGKPASLFISTVWGVESLWCIARYMADSRALVLPLLSGRTDGEGHDWRNLFSQWGILHKDTQIAGQTRLLASMILIYACFRLLKHWRNSTQKH